MQEKSTLTKYRKYKHSIKDEQNLYDNSAGTTTLFEARTYLPVWRDRIMSTCVAR